MENLQTGLILPEQFITINNVHLASNCEDCVVLYLDTPTQPLTHLLSHFLALPLQWQLFATSFSYSADLTALLCQSPFSNREL